MENIFTNVTNSLYHKLVGYDVTLSETKGEYYIYFRKNKEIVYLINISLLYKSTLVLDVKTLTDICLLVLKSRGLC